MPRWMLTVTLGLVLACSGFRADPPSSSTASATTTPAPVQAPAPAEVRSQAVASDTQLIVLAANFDSDAPCGKDDSAGCDLYAVRYDLASSAVISVDRLTNTPGVGELFPTVDRSGTFVVYTESQQRRQSLQAIHIPSKTRHTLVEGGTYASFSPTADQLAYSQVVREPGKNRSARKEVWMASLSTEDNRLLLRDARQISNGRDPQFSADGQEVVFHVRPEHQTTQPAVFNLTRDETVLLGGPDGCAHTTFSADGSVVFCGEGARVYTFARTDQRWAEPQPWTPPDLPERFAQTCQFSSLSFPDFCPSSDQALFSAGCHSQGGTRYTQVLLIDTAQQRVTDLHGQLEAFLGVSGKTSRSADCAG